MRFRTGPSCLQRACCETGGGVCDGSIVQVPTEIKSDSRTPRGV